MPMQRRGQLRARLTEGLYRFTPTMKAHSVQRIYFSILYLCFGGYGLLIIYGNVDKTKEKPISTSQRSWLFTTQRIKEK